MKIKKIKLNKIQKVIYYLAQENSNLLVVGSGGTGKSLLIRQIDKALSNTACLSFTGNASLNIEGQTIHSFFGFSFDKVDDMEQIKKIAKRQKRKFVSLKTIIIDELSMVRLDIFENMDRVLRFARNSQLPFGGVRLVLFSDFCQLRPVPLGGKSALIKEPFVFESDLWKRLRIKELSLLEPERTKDKLYSQIIEDLRIGQFINDNINELNKLIECNSRCDQSTVLTLTNRKANEINEFQMRKLQSRSFYSNATVSDSFARPSYPNDTNLELKIGMRLIFLVNATSYKNGQIGTLVDISKDLKEVSIKMDSGNIIKVKRHKWISYEYKTKVGTDKKYKLIKDISGHFTQFPFRACYAMTIHKAQGQTLDKMHLELTNSPIGDGQVYVALSRVRTRHDITVSRPLTMDDIKFCPIAVTKTTDIERSTIAKQKGYEKRYSDKSDYIEDEVITKSLQPSTYMREAIYSLAVEVSSIDELIVGLELKDISCKVNCKNDRVTSITLTWKQKTFPFSKVMKFGLDKLSNEYDIDLKTECYMKMQKNTESKGNKKKSEKNPNQILNKIFS